MYKFTKFDKANMQMAYITANLSYCQRRQVGAVIVRDDRVIANGVNGFLFSDGNVEELSHLLESAISMSEVEWLHMKTECRRLALEWPVEYNLEVLKDLFLEPS